MHWIHGWCVGDISFYVNHLYFTSASKLLLFSSWLQISYVDGWELVDCVPIYDDYHISLPAHKFIMLVIGKMACTYWVAWRQMVALPRTRLVGWAMGWTTANWRASRPKSASWATTNEIVTPRIGRPRGISLLGSAGRETTPTWRSISSPSPYSMYALYRRFSELTGRFLCSK